MIKYKINSIYYVWCGNMEWNWSNVLEKKYDHSINLPNNYARTGLLNVSLSGFCHFGLVLSMVLWQSSDTPILSAFSCERAASSVLESRALSFACLVSCWSVVFGSRHSCLEFWSRDGVRTLALHHETRHANERARDSSTLEAARSHENADRMGVSELCHKTMDNTRPKWQNPDSHMSFINHFSKINHNKKSQQYG